MILFFYRCLLTDFTKILKSEQSIVRSNWFHGLNYFKLMYQPYRLLPLEKLLVIGLVQADTITNVWAEKESKLRTDLCLA